MDEWNNDNRGTDLRQTDRQTSGCGPNKEEKNQRVKQQTDQVARIKETKLKTRLKNNAIEEK
jgi:hypothetical protein